MLSLLEIRGSRSQAQMAALLGRTQAEFSRFERRLRPMPIQDVVRLRSLVGLTDRQVVDLLVWLVNESDATTPSTSPPTEVSP